MEVANNETELQDILRTKPLVVIDAYIDRCAPCAILAPSLQNLSRLVAGVTFVKANFSRGEFSHIKEKHAVTRYPTLLYAVHGEIKDTSVGADLATILEDLMHWYEIVYDIN